METINLIAFYYVESKGCSFINPYQFTRGTLPMIWNNQGMYGFISREKVENIIQLLEDNEKLPGLDTKRQSVRLYWDEVEIIDPKVAKLLFKGG